MQVSIFLWLSARIAAFKKENFGNQNIETILKLTQITYIFK